VAVVSSDRPLVTVGIPFVNEERYLGAAVRSILAQTLTDLEILLVDDGSTDASLEIARSFRDERITVVSDGRRRFLPARLNQITARARGELIARMDADDVAHPDRLRRQVEVMRGEPDCVAVGSWAGLMNERDEPFGVIEAPPLASPAVVLEQGIFPHPTLVARRDWLLANPYDVALTRAEDRDLWCRTVSVSRFTVVREPLYVLRVVPSDATFLPDYLESQRQNRILFRRHGPKALGRVRASRAWAASIAKGLAMRMAVGAGVAERLVRRRGREPSEGELRLIREALQAGRHEP
jgi:glycosyltransferase involved in cell wall biosynthesis